MRNSSKPWHLEDTDEDDVMDLEDTDKESDEMMVLLPRLSDVSYI